MAWTPQQLKAAVLALVSPPADLQGKADAINTQTVTGSIPTALDVSGHDFARCVVYSEFAAQTAAVQAVILALMQMPSIPGGSASKFVAGLFTVVFGTMPQTVAAFTALAQAATTPVWQPAVTAGDIQTALAQP